MRDVRLYKISVATSLMTFFKNIFLVYAWVPFLMLLVLDMFLQFSVYGLLAMHLLSFILVYEAGYIASDVIGVTFEDKRIRRKIYDDVPIVLSLSGIVIRLLLVSLILTSLSAGPVVFLYVLTAVVFFLHASSKEHYRIGTFICLRILKGLVPYAFLLPLLPQEYVLLIFIGLLGTSIYYLIEYYIKKLGGKIEFDIFSFKNSLIKIWIVGLLTVLCLFIFPLSLRAATLFFTVFLINHCLYMSIRLFGNRKQTDVFKVVSNKKLEDSD
jgi:hypothetical protein